MSISSLPSSLQRRNLLAYHDTITFGDQTKGFQISLPKETYNEVKELWRKVKKRRHPLPC